MELDDRLTAIEQRLAALEGAPAGASISGDLWVLDNINDSVIFAGDVRTGAGVAQYQWHRPARMLLDEDWAPTSIGSPPSPTRCAGRS